MSLSPSSRPLLAQGSEGLLKAHSKQPDEQQRQADWMPILQELPPINTVIIVGNHETWCVAKFRRWEEAYVVWKGWRPSVRHRNRYAFTYADSRVRVIDFQPTHWKDIVSDPPPHFQRIRPAGVV